MRRVFILLALASLLFSLFPHPTLAQDEPDTDPNNSSQLFLPFVGGNQGNRVNLSAADLSIASESISVESTEAAATEKFQSRRLPAEALKPVSVIVVFGEGANPAQVEAISGGRVIHRYDADPGALTATQRAQFLSVPLAWNGGHSIMTVGLAWDGFCTVWDYAWTATWDELDALGLTWDEFESRGVY